MARRKNTSGFEDCMKLVAMLPWWAGVGLALISFLFLNQLAQPPSAQALHPGQMAGLVAGSLISVFATIGKFLVPIICLSGALGSFLARRDRKTLLTNVTQSKSADALDNMSWREFEMLVGEAFRLQGYRATEQGGAGPDGGIDLVLGRGTETFLVQCKQWKAFKVSVTVVRELYGVMAAKGAAGGFVITSGRFTEDAAEFASGRNIKLIDGPLLHGLIKQANNARSASGTLHRPVSSGSPSPTLTPAPAPRAASPLSLVNRSTPSCPTCGSSMARRKASRGANAGSEFWGCATYPACNGTRSL